MPYEISFHKALTVRDPDIYINECCWGGDVVRDFLLPPVVAKFGDVETEQEDWGWFIWFRQGRVKLAIDIFCDDPQKGEFRIRLTSRRKWLLFDGPAADTEELEELREFVVSQVTAWAGAPKVEQVD